MKRKMLAIALSLALLSSFLVFVVPVGATQPQTLSGTFSGPGAVPLEPPRYANGNMFLKYTSTHTLTGGFEGDMVSIGTAIFRPHGEWIMYAKGTFTGFFDGKEGTSDYTLILKGMIPFYSGKLIFSGGTGELAGFHAVVYADGGSGYVGTYTVKYHFDP